MRAALFVFFSKRKYYIFMDVKKCFDKKIYFLIRLAAIISAIIILIVNGYLLARELQYDKIFTSLIFNYIFINFVTVEVFLIVLIIFPYKFESIAVFAFLYTGILLYADPLNLICVPMYFLGILSLYLRGLLKSRKRLKIILLSIGAGIMLFSNIRYGWIFFLEDFVSKITCCIVCILIFMFFVMEKSRARDNNPVLDLTVYTELTERDKEWIELALSQEKYDTIARKYNLSPNYVKNRMRVIFKILGVPDRLALISAYSGWNLKKV